MKLIIVESPAKAKTIKNFLGKDFRVVASKGHIRDLPKHNFGIKIDGKKFLPEYEISTDHKDIINEIKHLAKEAEIVYIATDEDREGEAIGFHIAQILDKKADYPRIAFHEITKNAILKAIENPRKLNENMINAQQTRRLLDRIVGFKLSPLISQKIKKGLSAGRVQSAALKLIVDKEREIAAFKPIDYFSIDSIFSKNNAKIEAILVESGGKKIQKMDLRDKIQAQNMLDSILISKFSVQHIENKQKKVAPPPPFMTSTLQQSASSILNYSPARTMQIAQRLYEGVATNNGTTGLITYMRTDSLNIAKIAQNAALKVLERNFGSDYVPDKPRIYATKQKNAQEAHEAIRPTNLDFTPQIAKDFLKPDELKLYTLIYNRFLASQSTDAVFSSSSVLIGDSNFVFKANGSKLVFDGFYKILGSDDKDKILPHLELNEPLVLKECAINAHSTEPPPRFSEASLIKTLESLGIGRPSTYAPTISLLQNRDYIKVEKKQISANEISLKVIDMLQKHFLEIVDSKFTSNLEDKLDSIALCKCDWQEVLWEFYEPFMQKISEGKMNIESLKVVKQTGQKCPECGSELVIRNGKYGEFTACSGYPKCKYIQKDEKSSNGEITEEICEKCGKAMVKKRGKYGEFLACSGYPNCKNIKSLKKPITKISSVKCPDCGGNLVQRFSKRGAFWGCDKYPACKFLSKYELIDEKCPECGFNLAKYETKTKQAKICQKCKFEA